MTANMEPVSSPSPEPESVTPTSPAPELAEDIKYSVMVSRNSTDVEGIETVSMYSESTESSSISAREFVDCEKGCCLDYLEEADSNASIPAWAQPVDVTTHIIIPGVSFLPILFYYGMVYGYDAHTYNTGFG